MGQLCGDWDLLSISLAMVQLLNYMTNSISNVLFPFIVKAKKEMNIFKRSQK